jgi:hypothetical protein
MVVRGESENEKSEEVMSEEKCFQIFSHNKKIKKRRATGCNCNCSCRKVS